METMKTLKIIHAEKNVPGMTKEEIDKFLSTGRKILRFGTVDVDGGPAIHPVWYYYNNDKVYLFTGKNARKLQNVKKSAQVYFSIDTDAAPNKGVRGKGTARILTDPSKTVPLGEKIVGRYMDNIESGWGKDMVDWVRSGTSIIIEITPRYYTVWDYTKLMP